MLEICASALLLMRRRISRNKIDPPQIKPVRSGARHRQVAQVHRIKSPAKKSYLHARYLVCLFLKAACLETRFSLSAFFLALRLDATFFFTGPCSSRRAASRISTTRLPQSYFSSGMPSPVTADTSYKSNLS